MERTALPLHELKFDAASTTDADASTEAMTFSGYGAVFGNVDSYGDVIAPGAFKATLAAAKKASQWPAMLLQHGGFGMNAEDMTPIGVWTAMSEDDVGLKVEGKLADTPRGREAYTLMKMTPRPAITGLSIGYAAKEFTIGTKPEEPRRLLKKIELYEVSLVTFPANQRARVSGVKGALDNERDIERWLMQDAGLSRREARIVINSGFKSLLAMQDADEQPRDTSQELRELEAAIRAATSALRV